MNQSLNPMNPAGCRKLPHRMDNFVSVARILSVPSVLLVSAGVKPPQGTVGAAEFRSALTGHGLVPRGGSSASFRQCLVDDAGAREKIIRAHRISVE